MSKQKQVAPAQVETPAPAMTIKKLITTGIAAGKTTKEIAVELAEKFPASAAAAKSVKHIAWYRTKMKQGKITV